MSKSITEQSFFVLSVWLCVKAIYENWSSAVEAVKVYHFSLAGSAHAQAVTDGNAQFISGTTKGVIAVLLSIGLLILIGITTWAAYFKKPPSDKAESYLQTILTSTFVLLSGLLGVTLR